MANRTYAISEIVGTSTESIDQAIRNGIKTASKSLRNLDWFEVKETRGYIDGDEPRHFQVVMKVGFRYDDDDD